MSKSKSKKRRTLRVTIPAVNIGLVRGAEDLNEEEELKSVERKKARLMGLELDAEVLGAEADVERARKNLEASRGDETQNSKSDLGERLLEEVVVPIVRKNLEGDKTRDEDIASRALRVAERTLSQGGGRGSPMSIVNEVIGAIKGLRDLTGDEGLHKRLDDIETKVETIGKRGDEDAVDQLDKVLNTINKVKEFLGATGEGRGGDLKDTKLWIEQRRWEKRFERDALTRDRAYQLKIRQQDKAHDIELGKLGVERDRNKLIEEGFQRVGRAVYTALGEEEEYEEEEPPARVKGRRTLVKTPCSQCGTDLTIPPEAQILGKEIKCPKCNSVFEWEEE